MASVFVDTNVILYTRDMSSPDKAAMASAWLRSLAPLRAMTMSRQVLNEAYYVLTRRSQFKVPTGEARGIVQALERFARAPSNSQTLLDAWAIEDRYGLRFWDAMLMASAHAAGCAYFLSEDLNDGQVYGAVQAINPFRHAPEDVLGRAASV